MEPKYSLEELNVILESLVENIKSFNETIESTIVEFERAFSISDENIEDPEEDWESEGGSLPEEEDTDG